MNDAKILGLLKAGKRSTAFSRLYKAYPQVESLILNKGGSKEDAKDIFQDALIIFYKKVRANDFELSAAISTYLYSVFRFLWKDELIKRKRSSDHLNQLPEEDPLMQEEMEKILQKEAKLKRLESVLSRLGEKCLEILTLFYFQHWSMKQIARKQGLSSAKVAKNQKYKCIERAKMKLQDIASNRISD